MRADQFWRVRCSNARDAAGEGIARFVPTSRGDLATAAVRADQCGQPGHAELFRQVMAGGLSVAFAKDRAAMISADELDTAGAATLLVIGDDDYAAAGPAGWTCAANVVAWSAAAVIHAAGAMAGIYAEAAHASRLLGRVVMVETDAAHAADWAAAMADKPAMIIMPRGGVHPALPAGRTLQ